VSCGIAHPDGNGLAELVLVSKEWRDLGQPVNQIGRQTLPKLTDCGCLVLWCRQATKSLEGKPAKAVWFCTWMREKILGDALQPERSKRVEAGFLQGVEQVPLRYTGGPMTFMSSRIMKACPQCETISERAQSRVSGGFRLRDGGVGIVEA
jgi:hypothetical protein